jgi:hypothetical protein
MTAYGLLKEACSGAAETFQALLGKAGFHNWRWTSC